MSHAAPNFSSMSWGSTERLPGQRALLYAPQHADSGELSRSPENSSVFELNFMGTTRKQQDGPWSTFAHAWLEYVTRGSPEPDVPETT